MTATQFTSYDMRLRLLKPDADFTGVLTLIRDAFAYMDGIVDPPSSMHSLSVTDSMTFADQGEVWVIESSAEVIACMVLTPRNDALYLGKLAVHEDFRGLGLARRMVEAAEASARRCAMKYLELQTRVELSRNQNIFIAMGFAEAGRARHSGYNRDTSITYRKAV